MENTRLLENPSPPSESASTFSSLTIFKFFRILIVLTVFSLASCTHLFYQPDRYLYAPPEKLNLKYENIFFGESVRLHGWFFPGQDSKKSSSKMGKSLFVLFHGNAQNLSSHYLSLSWLVQYGHDVFVWDYRGYGLSQGEPDGEGIYQDSQTALDFATELYKNTKNGLYKNFFLVGQSLGGNILLKALVDFPQRWPITAITIDSSFSSYQDLAKDRMKTVWALYPFSFLSSLLISDKFAPKEKLSLVKIPALVMHSEQDQVVPSPFGEEIFTLLGSPRKEYWKIQNARHIGTLGNGDPKTEEKFLGLLQLLYKK